jgi:hypothetical protein
MKPKGVSAKIQGLRGFLELINYFPNKKYGGIGLWDSWT